MWFFGGSTGFLLRVLLLYLMISSVDGSDRNLDVKRESRRRRVFALYMGGKTQVEIARELGIDRGTVRLDLDAVRGEYEVASDSVEFAFWGAYERVLQLRSELLKQAREAGGSQKAKLYGQVAKIDCKLLDRFMDPALMASRDSDRRFDIGKLVMEWIAETHGVDALRDFMEHIDSHYRGSTSRPDYR